MAQILRSKQDRTRARQNSPTRPEMGSFTVRLQRPNFDRYIVALIMPPSRKRIRKVLVNGMSTVLSGTPPKNGPCKSLTVNIGVAEFVGGIAELGGAIVCRGGFAVVVAVIGRGKLVAETVVVMGATGDLVKGMVGPSVGKVVIKPGFCLSSTMPAFTMAAKAATASTTFSRAKQMDCNMIPTLQAEVFEAATQTREARLHRRLYVFYGRKRHK